jgi:hypothetical protein
MGKKLDTGYAKVADSEQKVDVGGMVLRLLNKRIP